MTVFADTSAIVKLFALEAHTDLLRAEPGPFAVSALSRVELTSALWQKSRTGALSPRNAARLSAAARAQLAEGRFASGAEVVELLLDGSVLASAAGLCALHALRAGDAIQLATALRVREVDASCNRFWVFDQRLADAAVTEGFAVLGPEC